MPKLTQKDLELIEFNKLFKKLILDISNQKKDDAILWDVRNKVKTAIDLNPTLVLEKVSKWLFLFKNEIRNQDVSFFLNLDLSRYVKNNDDEILYIIIELKKLIKKMNSVPLLDEVRKLLSICEAYKN
ncbi:Uncharacterised protein [uncultured archaeon]|nr:Uncharacterised protein [uncultured archaeon]